MASESKNTPYASPPIFHPGELSGCERRSFWGSRRLRFHTFPTGWGPCLWGHRWSRKSGQRCTTPERCASGCKVVCESTSRREQKAQTVTSTVKTWVPDPSKDGIQSHGQQKAAGEASVPDSCTRERPMLRSSVCGTQAVHPSEKPGDLSERPWRHRGTWRSIRGRFSDMHMRNLSLSLEKRALCAMAEASIWPMLSSICLPWSHLCKRWIHPVE